MSDGASNRRGGDANGSQSPLAQSLEHDAARAGFIAAMRKAASTVCVVTTAGPAGRYGVTVSAMTSVSADPPAVLVCVKDGNLVVPAITGNGVLCVNMLRDSHRSISEVFAGRMVSDAEDRFVCADWTTLTTGSPVLTDASAAFDCRLSESHAFGTHTLFIGEVVSVELNDGPPLVYHDRNYCRVAAMS